MRKLFLSLGIIRHLEDHDLLHKQIIEILGKRLRKDYALDHFYGLPEGLHCIIVEMRAYSENEYYQTIPWVEIDQWVKENQRKEFSVEEAFSRIKQAYLKCD